MEAFQGRQEEDGCFPALLSGFLLVAGFSYFMGECAGPTCKACNNGKNACAEDRLLAAFYRKVIERYEEKISFGEEKSVVELKKLVEPSPEVVEESKKISGGEGVVEEFPSYALNCLDFLKGVELLSSGLKFSFWLKPSEVLELGAGDSMDKALLLCSLLSARGSSTASVRVVELEDGVKHALVCFEHSGTAYVLDASVSSSWSGPSVEDVLSQVLVGGKKVLKSLYEFNSESYSSFQ